MLKILQARLQWYRNHELPDVQAGFRKCRGTLMAESEEELKSLLMKVKEESEKTELKLNI